MLLFPSTLTNVILLASSPTFWVKWLIILSSLNTNNPVLVAIHNFPSLSSTIDFGAISLPKSIFVNIPLSMQNFVNPFFLSDPIHKFPFESRYNAVIKFPTRPSIWENLLPCSFSISQKPRPSFVPIHKLLLSSTSRAFTILSLCRFLFK